MDGTSPDFCLSQCRTAQPYDRAGIEPPVEELLADPMLHKLLVRDRITLMETRRAVAEARRRLGIIG